MTNPDRISVTKKERRITKKFISCRARCRLHLERWTSSAPWWCTAWWGGRSRGPALSVAWWYAAASDCRTSCRGRACPPRTWPSWWRSPRSRGNGTVSPERRKTIKLHVKEEKHRYVRKDERLKKRSYLRAWSDLWSALRVDWEQEYDRHPFPCPQVPSLPRRNLSRKVATSTIFLKKRETRVHLIHLLR